MRSLGQRCALALLISGLIGTLQAADPSCCTPSGCLPQPLTCAAPCFSNGTCRDGTVSGMGGQGNIGPDGQPVQAAAQDDFSDLGGVQSGYFSSTIAFGGLGISSASATGGPTFPATNVQTSLISPGLLTASTVQPTVPMDRVFGGYSYYNAFQVTSLAPTITGPTNLSTRQAGFNLNMFNVGIEKTILNENASVYVQVPFLFATDNITTQKLDGLGDVSVGFKALLLATQDNKNALSVGLTVATPTAHTGQFVASQQWAGGTLDPTTAVTLRVNPTIIQPWISGLVTFDRLFVQNYFGVLIPTSDQVVTSANENLAVGYRLWEGSDGLITSITPILNTQVLIPLQGSGSPTPIGFPTQTFVTEGVQLGVGQRASVFAGVTEPVSGPKAFDLGATFGFNLLY